MMVGRLARREAGSEVDQIFRWMRREYGGSSGSDGIATSTALG